jgi:hypothetical protein
MRHKGERVQDPPLVQMLFVIVVALILAWKVAGYIGADYFLLRWIGTSAKNKPPTAQAEALMAWDDDGGAGTGEMSPEGEVLAGVNERGKQGA